MNPITISITMTITITTITLIIIIIRAQNQITPISISITMTITIITLTMIIIIIRSRIKQSKRPARPGLLEKTLQEDGMGDQAETPAVLCIIVLAVGLGLCVCI